MKIIGGGAAGALTGDSQVGVGLDLSGHVSGEALEHPRVVGQEAVDLQAASDQHPVPGRLHRVDGRSVFVPHDVWLRDSCKRAHPGFVFAAFFQFKVINSKLNSFSFVKHFQII